tara:strand:+ start:344 stop:583 length:240 start_codon:yes stop_codon:yes gene_type:complete
MRNLIRRAKKEHRYNNSMTIELTDSDKEYAKKHGLSYGEMRDFKEDQIREEEMMVTWYQMKEKERKDFENSPQAIYAAW